jgi:hypothetical protein
VLGLQGTITHWLDLHSGSVTGLATVVLCLVTAVYVAVTYALLREERAQYREPEVARDLSDVDLTGQASLQVRNLGPGLAVDVNLLAGPKADLPVGVGVEDLGTAFNLAVGDTSSWRLAWTYPPPTCDIRLTLMYFDRSRKAMWLDAFVIRLGPSGIGTSAGWFGELSARGLKAMARSTIPRSKRLAHRWTYRRNSLHELLVDAGIKSVLAADVAANLEAALTWEGELRKDYGRL